jgi:hypothetical protein
MLDIYERHSGTVTRHHFGCLSAEPLRRTRDHDHLALELHKNYSFVVSEPQRSIRSFAFWREAGSFIS